MEEVRGIVPPKLGNEKYSSPTFSEDFEEKFLGFLSAANPSAVPDADLCKLNYEKLQKNLNERCSLQKVHLARGHRYGLSHFGPKRWYKEQQGLAKKLKTQADRW